MTAPRDPIEAPVTEAIDAFLRKLAKTDPEILVWIKSLLAERAAARAEGRQEAVRLDVEFLAIAMGGVQAHHSKDNPCLGERTRRDWTEEWNKRLRRANKVAAEYSRLLLLRRSDDARDWFDPDVDDPGELTVSVAGKPSHSGNIVARHGRSSDPEPAHTQECVIAFYSDGGQSGCICEAENEPALHYTRPEDARFAELVRDTSNDPHLVREAERILAGAVPALQATGEPPRPVYGPGHECHWKRKYDGMVQERDDQVRRKRGTRRMARPPVDALVDAMILEGVPTPKVGYKRTAERIIARLAEATGEGERHE